MGDHITGIKAMKEISATVKGANQHATKVFRKSFAAPEAQTPTQPDPAVTDQVIEEPEMDKAIMKALLSLNDAGRAYAAGLEDDAMEVFLKKSAVERDAEVAADTEAKAKAAAAEAEAEKAKSAGDPTVSAMKTELEVLKSERAVEKAEKRTAEIEKTAAQLYPGVPKAAEIMKSIDGLSDEQKAPTLAMLASQQELTKKFLKTAGDDAALPGTATAKHDAKVEEVAKEKSISKAAATVLVAEDPANGDLIAEMRAEMAG